jgi:hypothetical protein
VSCQPEPIRSLRSSSSLRTHSKIRSLISWVGAVPTMPSKPSNAYLRTSGRSGDDSSCVPRFSPFRHVTPEPDPSTTGRAFCVHFGTQSAGLNPEQVAGLPESRN